LPVFSETISSQQLVSREAPVLLDTLVSFQQPQPHPVLQRAQQPQQHIVLQQQQQQTFQPNSSDSAFNGLISQQQQQQQQQLQTYPVLERLQPQQSQQSQTQHVGVVQQYSESKLLDDSFTTEDNKVSPFVQHIHLCHF
jgi:hypothetical protein